MNAGQHEPEIWQSQCRSHKGNGNNLRKSYLPVFVKASYEKSNYWDLNTCRNQQGVQEMLLIYHKIECWSRFLPINLLKKQTPCRRPVPARAQALLPAALMRTRRPARRRCGSRGSSLQLRTLSIHFPDWSGLSNVSTFFRAPLLYSDICPDL